VGVETPGILCTHFSYLHAAYMSLIPIYTAAAAAAADADIGCQGDRLMRMTMTQHVGGTEMQLSHCGAGRRTSGKVSYRTVR